MFIKMYFKKYKQTRSDNNCKRNKEKKKIEKEKVSIKSKLCSFATLKYQKKKN